MSLKLKLTNRSTGEERIVSPDVWDSYLRTGRSKFWTVEPIEEKSSKPKPKAKEEPVKEEIVIKPIKSKPKKEENENETN